MFNFISGHYSGYDALFSYIDTDGFLCTMSITTTPKTITEAFRVKSNRNIEHEFVYRGYYLHCSYKMPKYLASSIEMIYNALGQFESYCEQFEQLIRASIDIANYNNTSYRDKAKYNKPNAPYLKEFAEYVYCCATRQSYKPKNSIVFESFGMVKTYFYSDDYDSLCEKFEEIVESYYC